MSGGVFVRVVFVRVVFVRGGFCPTSRSNHVPPINSQGHND